MSFNSPQLQNLPNSTSTRSADPIVSARCRRLAAAGAITSLVVAGGLSLAAVAGAATSGPASSDQLTVVAQDAFDRTLTTGWGSAEVGGSYTVSSGATTSTNGGAGRIAGLAPGSAFTASLIGAQAADVRARMSVLIPALPTAGSEYFNLGLRGQSNGSRYVAKARVTPDGTVGLSFSRIVNNVETFLDTETPLSQKVTAGSVLTIEAQATGSSTVSLNSHAWVGSTTAPSWLVSDTDTDASRIATTGFLSSQLYVSRSAPAAVSASITDLMGWRVDPAAAPSSAASSSAAATTSPAPVTDPSTSAPSTSSAPVSTDPTTPAPSTSASTTPAAPPTTAPVTPPTTDSPSTTPSNGPSTPPTTPPVTTDPPVSSDRGAAPLGTTAYPVPAGAVWVSPTGSDSAAGSASAPVLTITRAIAIAPAGGTIVLKAGTYHESLSVPSAKPLTIQSAPNSVVWLDGSSAVSGWTKSGSTWVHSGWTAQFDSTPSYTASVSTAPFWGMVNATHPMAAHPEELYINGEELSQVASAAAVVPGTFYTDYVNDQLVLGSDPSAGEVRATDLGIAMSLKSPNSTIRGIGIRRFATAVRDMGSVRITGANSTFENNVVTEIATTGISVLSTGAKVNHDTFYDNGLLGVHANNADNISITSVIADHNNTEGFNTAPVAGGIKISRTRGITIRNSEIARNLGPGVWFDESSYNATFIGNTVDGNAGHGFSMEISSTGVIADNVVTNNKSDGLKINDTNNVQIWNNTFGGNGLNIELVQDTRDETNPSTPGHDPRQSIPDPTVPWKISNIQVMNNILPLSGRVNINVRDYSSKRSALQMGITIDGNLLTRTTVKTDRMVIWQLAGNNLTIAPTVAALAATGAGSHNAEIVNGVASSNDPASYARPLPAGVAALVGQPAGTLIVGAF